MKYRLISKYLAAIWKPKEEKVWSTEVTDEKCNTLVKDEFGAIYSRYWKKLFSAPRSLSGEYSIRKGVKVIGNSAFSRCYFLTSINIPNSVTTIGNGAFAECNSLTSINIPNSVTTIGDGAFSECKSLTSINIPDSVTTIGKEAFIRCYSLTSINIPNSVTMIGNDAFRECINLPSHFKSDIIQRFGRKVFCF